MIVCRRPCTLFDVDIAGVVGLLLLAAGGAWLALGPWRQTWTEYRHLARQRAELRATLQDDVARVERYERGVRELTAIATDQLAHAPTKDSYPDLLRQMADLAVQSELQLLSVTPQPAVPQGPYLISDVQVGARGRSHDFILFLDRLAQENPYQVLRACTLSRSPATSDPVCELNFTVRMYLLATSSAPRAGAGP